MNNQERLYLIKFAKSEAWQKSEGKNSEGGLNEKGRKSYEKANPGSDLKAPVTQKNRRVRLRNEEHLFVHVWVV